MARRARTTPGERLPAGIFRDRRGFRVWAYVRKPAPTKRFPPDTTIERMQAWQLRQRADVLEPPASDSAPAPEPGTLAADVARYLRIVHAMPTIKTRTKHLADWVSALGGARTRESVTTAEVAEILATWQRRPNCSNSQLNHRRGALSNLYRRLDPSGRNPVRGVPKFREPDPQPRGLPLVVVQAILDALSARDLKDRGSAPSRTAAQLRVMATTGLPPATIARLQPKHLAQLDDGIIIRPGRRKGRGTADSRHSVTPQGAAALRLWAAVGEWRPVPSSTRLIVWRRAVAKARAAHPDYTIPDDVVPYDLRHSIGDAVYDATGDLTMVQEVLGHADIRTSRRYAAAAIQRREVVALNKVATAWLEAETIVKGAADE
jgi:integrase